MTPNFLISKKIKTLSLTFFFITLLSSKSVYSQTSSNNGISAVSQIIIPATANIEHNFNLLYRIKLSRTEIQTPTFWYKLIFDGTCNFNLTLLPLNETDSYDFYFYKIKDNADYCTSIGNGSIVSLDSLKEKKLNPDINFKADLVSLKSIDVNPGDAIYIEVISIKGNDGGHVIDFRTCDNTSFTIKVINQSKISVNDSLAAKPNPSDSAKIEGMSTPTIIADIKTEEEFCKVLNSAGVISSISLQNGKEPVIEQKANVGLTNKDAKQKDGTPTGDTKDGKPATTQSDSKKSGTGDAVTKSSTEPKNNTASAKDKHLSFSKEISISKHPKFIEDYTPPEGLAYKVQVGFYKADVHVTVFNGISPVSKEMFSDGTRFFAGLFSSHEDAQKAKDFCVGHGIKDAFVVCYYNGKRISRQEALNLEKNN